MLTDDASSHRSHRNGGGRAVFEMADLQAPAVAVDVALDHVGAYEVGLVEAGQGVAGPVRDREQSHGAMRGACARRTGGGGGHACAPAGARSRTPGVRGHPGATSTT